MLPVFACIKFFIGGERVIVKRKYDAPTSKYVDLRPHGK
jgi:hypothetical protein